MDYDPDRRVLWHLGGSSQGTANSLRATYEQKGLKIKEEGNPEKIKGKGPPLWRYDLKANQWSLVITEDPSGCARDRGYIRYFPPLKKLLMTPCIVSPNEDTANWKAYDPSTNAWEALKIAWKPLDNNVSRYWGWGYSPIVFDAKRRALALILGGSGGGTWLMDPVKKTCEQVVAGDKSLQGNLDGPVGGYVYDAVGGTMLALFVDYETYEGGKTLQQRGFPIDESHVWALDVEKKAWVLQPKPSNGVLPPLKGMGCIHLFHDPAQNATVVYRGGYDRADTETWVYRFRKAAK